ncbi:MAG: LptF/LptG family permease [Planctomycetes bacterium]|nr:LptF/LptG family permease [Planctomycetota bacterium]
MTFHLYLLRQLLLAFVVAAVGMVFIALPGIAVGAVSKLGSVGMVAVLRFLPLVVAGFVPFVLPVSLLLALVSTYGRLAAQNEWTAIRMAGVNPYRLLLPAFALSTLVGVGIYGMNSELLPRIRVQQKTVRIDALRNAFKNLSPGLTHIEEQGFLLQASYRDPVQKNTFYDCFVSLPSKGDEPPRGFYAETARFEFKETELAVHLHNARGAEDSVQGAAERLSIVVPYDKIVGGERKHDFGASRYQRSPALLERIASGELTPAERRGFLYAWHERLANASTCLLFVLIGASTGVLMRKGTQLAALAVAVGYAMLYWVLSMRLGEQLVESEVLTPAVGAWAPLGAFTLWGLFLMHRSLRE